jgi:hypothetical protein
MTTLSPHRPYKSVAGALLFSILFGPVGLLYASFWGGVIMTMLGIVVISNKYLFLVLLLWLICAMWSVRAVELYNRKLDRIKG